MSRAASGEGPLFSGREGDRVLRPRPFEMRQSCASRSGSATPVCRRDSPARRAGSPCSPESAATRWRTAAADPLSARRCAGKPARLTAPASAAAQRNVARPKSASAPSRPPGSRPRPRAAWPRSRPPFSPSRRRPAAAGSSGSSSADRRAVPRSPELAHSLGQRAARGESAPAIRPVRNGSRRSAPATAPGARREASAWRKILPARSFPGRAASASALEGK